MKAGLLIRRLSWVSVFIAVVSLPRILTGLFPLPSSGVAGDSVSETAERPGSAPASRERAISAPHALGERREEAKSSDRPLPAPSTERADLSELESAQRTLEQLQQAHTEQEAADYDASLRSAATRGSAADMTEREQAERELQRLQQIEAEREAAAYEESLRSAAARKPDSDVTIQERTEQRLRRVQAKKDEQEAADYEESLRSVTPSGSDPTEREQAEQHLQRLQEIETERAAADYEESLQSID